MRERAKILLSESMGVGTTYIDFDTFNVEGLWACFKEKVPLSTDFMTVTLLDNQVIPWQEHLVVDLNRMAEYEFIY